MPPKLLLSLLALAACLGACAGSADPTPKPKAKAAEVDVCEGSKPPWREYDGPLKGVRCEQEQFARMATIATHLDVDCSFCHVPKDGSKKSFDYTAMTERKRTALWMHRTFFAGLERRDGKPTQCSNCHVDKAGKPAAKFLGSPRDEAYAVEWMTARLTNDFVLPDGSKLKCRHCHDATWGMDGFQRKVIGRDLPFAPPSPGAMSPPSASAPPADPSAPAATSSSVPVPSAAPVPSSTAAPPP